MKAIFLLLILLIVVMLISFLSVKNRKLLAKSNLNKKIKSNKYIFFLSSLGYVVYNVVRMIYVLENKMFFEMSYLNLSINIIFLIFILFFGFRFFLLKQTGK